MNRIKIINQVWLGLLSFSLFWFHLFCLLSLFVHSLLICCFAFCKIICHWQLKWITKSFNESRFKCKKSSLHILQLYKSSLNADKTLAISLKTCSFMFYTKLLRAGQVSYCCFTQPDQLRHISEAVTGGVLENFAIIKNC